MKKSILTLLVLLPIVCHAQYGNVWCFGQHYGLDFNSGVPVFFDTTAIDTREGSASVCDSLGQLLFYTDGASCWNKTHQQMPNGFDLGGGISSVQPAVIVPYPMQANKYFVFTTDHEAYSNGLRYSVVDISLNNGLGDVILKSEPLITPVCEKLAATRHCNGRDWWIITRMANSDEFVSYLVDTSGVINNPVYSSTGLYDSISPSVLWYGQIKISPNGKWLSASYASPDKGIELCSFNNSTGNIQVVLRDFNPYTYSYGNAFSYDSKFLYVGYAFEDIFNPMNDFYTSRYNLASFDSNTIIQSKFRMLQRDSVHFYGGLQLGPDHHIYAFTHIEDSTTAQGTRTRLFVIKQLQDSVSELPFHLNYPQSASLGLSDFYDGIFTNHQRAALKIPLCSPANTYDSIPFFDSLLTTTHDYLWDFGEPSSGALNTSTDDIPVHYYSTIGAYTVTLTLQSDCNPLTITHQINITQVPPTIPIITLNNSSLESTPATQYQWYFNNNIIPSATAQSYLPITNGNYTVTITDSSGCSQTSQIYNLTTIGLKNTPNKNQFTVYPNPATETLHLINTTKKQATVVLYDISGRPILQTTIYNYNETIDISHITNGVYFIKIDNTFNQKLVISK